MRTESAEMTKHGINAWLALSVTFANELARLCEAVGALTRARWSADCVRRGASVRRRTSAPARLSRAVRWRGT